MPDLSLWHQKRDHAIYLPSLQSQWIATVNSTIKKLRPDGPIPGLLTSTSALNFMGDPEKAAFWWPRALCSPGAKATLPKKFPRAVGSSLLMDSSGFQIAQGRWDIDWADASVAERKRKKILAWQEALGDELIVLDIPSRTVKLGKEPYRTFEDTLRASTINARWWAEHATKDLINTLHGKNAYEVLEWYKSVKQDDNKFIGWTIPALEVSWTITLEKTRLLLDLEGDRLKRIHYLGRGTKEAALAYTAVKRAVMKRSNAYLDITYDNSTPFKQAGMNKITITERPDGSFTVFSQDAFYIAWEGPFKKYRIEGWEVRSGRQTLDTLAVAVMAAHGTAGKIAAHQTYINACTAASERDPRKTGLSELLENFLHNLRHGRMDSGSASQIVESLKVVTENAWLGAEVLDAVEEYLYCEKPRDFLLKNKKLFDEWFAKSRSSEIVYDLIEADPAPTGLNI